jgi:ABC-type nitrate/sulfonate/bicarbonate transport system substrate-binding protein
MLKKMGQANPELTRKYYKKWEQANSDTVNAIKAKRRAAKKNALTLWANANAIKNFYTEARRLTEVNGRKVSCGSHISVAK